MPIKNTALLFVCLTLTGCLDVQDHGPRPDGGLPEDGSRSDAASPPDADGGAALCGNGLLDPAETCDTGIASGTDACPRAGDCADAIACTRDEIVGSGCQAACVSTPIDAPADGDGCCPPGATAGDDDDCDPGCGDGTCDGSETCSSCSADCGSCCGNGELDAGESCDEGSGTECPTSCDDSNDCTTDVLTGGAASCDAVCSHEPVTACGVADGCCPSRCTDADDTDCSPSCTDACTEGEQRCAGTSVETCERGGDGCTDWSAPVSCPFGADSFPRCSGAGECSIGCNTGFTDCDEMPDNGCEVQTSSDIDNCGACGNVCGTTGGTASCGDACSIACWSGRADCDGANANGCEVSLLTNASNCGSCGHSCLGGSCSDGACQAFTLASGLVSPVDLAVDDSYVYVVDQGTSDSDFVDGGIYRVAKTGGALEPVATGLRHPVAVTVDDTHVYFTTLGPKGLAYQYPDGAVWRVPKAGGAATQLRVSVPAPWDLIVGETYVYWASGGTYSESGGAYFYNYDGSIGRVVKSGGASEILVSSLAEPVALAFTGWYGSEGPGLLWANRAGFDSSGGGVQERDTSGRVSTVITGEPFPSAVASDTTYAYYTVSQGGIRRVLLSNPANQPPDILAPTSGGSVEQIALDDTHVWWPNGSLNRVPLSGGTVEELNDWRSPQGYDGVAVDETAVYWTSRYSGAVLMIAK